MFTNINLYLDHTSLCAYSGSLVIDVSRHTHLRYRNFVAFGIAIAHHHCREKWYKKKLFYACLSQYYTSSVINYLIWIDFRDIDEHEQTWQRRYHYDRWRWWWSDCKFILLLSWCSILHKIIKSYIEIHVTSYEIIRLD
mgnify:CR=1 FL=1